MFLGFLLQATTLATDTATAIANNGVVKQDLSIIQLLLKGGVVMVPVLLLSVWAIFIIIERVLFIRNKTKVSANFVNDVVDKLYSGNIQGAQALCLQNNSSYSKVIETGISQLGKPLDDIEKMMETAANIEMAEMEKRMGYLGLISSIAPMLGFVGTIIGVIAIFYNITKTGTYEITTISDGLYQKMISSGTGLTVGILAYTGFSVLNVMIDKYSLNMQKYIFDFLKGIQKPVK